MKTETKTKLINEALKQRDALCKACQEIVDKTEVKNHPGNKFGNEVYDSAAFDYGYNTALYEMKKIIAKHVKEILPRLNI